VEQSRSSLAFGQTWNLEVTRHLEPGVTVRDVPMPESESGRGMVIEINNVRVH
jgi:hypothetical protein